MQNSLLKNWNIARLLRLVQGIIILVESIKSGMWMMIVLGSVFILMPLLNIGCCANGNCSVPQKKNSKPNENNEITYEEVKN